MNQEMATKNHPQDLEEEEEALLLQETAARNSSSPFFNEPSATTNHFSNLHLSNRPPCTSCGSAPTFSFGSHKRPTSENPTIHLEPKNKKPNNSPHSLFGFSKIPLSPPPFLRRCSSDLCNPPLPPAVEEPPLSPQPNGELECPGTPLSNAVASNKLPPRHPVLKRSVSDPLHSPAKTYSNSSDSPHAEWLRKMRDCIKEMSRKWDEYLADDEDPVNEELNNNDISNGINKESNNDATMDHSDAGYVEAVSVEKKGEALILHFKCPCGIGYQILLLGGNCYYKLM